MPGPIEEHIVEPESERIIVALEPAHNVLNTIGLLVNAQSYAGLSEWLIRTAMAMTPQERQTGRLVYLGFYFTLLPEQSWPSFPAYVDHLAARDAVQMRDALIAKYVQVAATCGKLDRAELGRLSAYGEAVLKDVDTYLGFLDRCFGSTAFEVDVETKAYEYLVDPPAMQALIVSYLRGMWENYLAEEWERIEPTLLEAVMAFQQVDFDAMSRLEAIQFVTGQVSEEKAEWWAERLKTVERLVFVPSAHLGSYLGTFQSGGTMWVLFRARLPEGSTFHAPALSRAEIIMRLEALADETRLSILQLVADEGELSSPEMIQRLKLSQSTASRHLKQLSATGYLVERRCNGAKCYSINGERIKSALQAVATLLHLEE